MSLIEADKRARASHIFTREQNDHYAEPLWVSERLFDVLDLPHGTMVVDPACGFGRIIRSACKAGLQGSGLDVVPRWHNQPDGPHPSPAAFVERDFLTESWICQADVIASNPPFKHAEKFTQLALERTGSIVALLLPTKWIQGDKRSRWLATTPLEFMMPLSPRPSMPPGFVWLSGESVGGGTVDFSWFIWRKGYGGLPQIRWLRRSAT